MKKKLLFELLKIINIDKFRFEKIPSAHFRCGGSQNGGLIIESIFEQILHKINIKGDIKSTNFYHMELW